jgi:hypothetical protein
MTDTNPAKALNVHDPPSTPAAANGRCSRCDPFTHGHPNGRNWRIVVICDHATSDLVPLFPNPIARPQIGSVGLPSVAGPSRRSKRRSDPVISFKPQGSLPRALFAHSTQLPSRDAVGLLKLMGWK